VQDKFALLTPLSPPGDLPKTRVAEYAQAEESFVLKASPEFEQLAVNPLGEQTNSSIVISDGEIFIRTHEHLWCVGEWSDRPSVFNVGKMSCL